MTASAKPRDFCRAYRWFLQVALLLAPALVWPNPMAVEAADKNLPDGRTILGDTTTVPAKYVGKIQFNHPSGEVYKDGRCKGTLWQTQGSGALIGPRHVLTAAHVIWQNDFLRYGKKDGFPPDVIDITFIPGLNGEEEPYCQAKVIGIYMQENYQKEAKRSMDNVARMDLDIAVLLLDKDISKKVGGHFQIKALSEDDLTKVGKNFFANGYDRDQDEPVSRFQLTRSGSLSRWHRRPGLIDLKDWSLYYTEDWMVLGGSSGGPVWYMDGDKPTIVGVNGGWITKWDAFFIKRVPPFSHGVFLNQGYVDWVKAYIKNNP